MSSKKIKIEKLFKDALKKLTKAITSFFNDEFLNEKAGLSKSWWTNGSVLFYKGFAIAKRSELNIVILSDFADCIFGMKLFQDLRIVKSEKINYK